MRKSILLLFLIFIFTGSHGQSHVHSAEAKNIVEKSMRAMGYSAWDTVRSFSMESYGYQNTIDESERSEGPFIPQQILRRTLKDLSHNRFEVTQTQLVYKFKGTTTYLFNDHTIAVKNGTKMFPTKEGDDLQDDLNLSPELILKKAVVSPNLQLLKDTLFQKARHHLLFFRYDGYPVRVFLNMETNFLTAVEVTKPYESTYAGIWGDSKRTTIYSFWMLLGKGLHYPLVQDTYLNGWYKSSFMINSWEINPTLQPDSLKIPDDVKGQGKYMAQRERDGLKKQLDDRTKQIGPGIWLLPGPCNSSIVEQTDGIVVIEGPYSSFYGELIIKKAAELFPAKKIKAVVTTSDAWLHLGGIRAFAAIPGIKIYHPARNKFILEKLLKARYDTEPDKLAKTSKPSYILKGVTDTMAVGSGNNRLVIYAYKTETGDRQSMVYFPGHKLLYTSDHFQPKDENGVYWNPEIIWEVYHSIKARKLDVKQFYAMHSEGLIPFNDMKDDVQKGMD
jgi:hypothetical protein